MTSFSIRQDKGNNNRYQEENPPLQYLIIKGTELERVDSYKFLGLKVTSNLNWTLNFTAIVKKAQQWASLASLSGLETPRRQGGRLPKGS